MSFRHWVFIHMRVIKICSPNLGLSQPYFTGLKYGTVFHTFQGPLLPCSERGRMQLSAAGGAPRYPIVSPKHRPIPAALGGAVLSPLQVDKSRPRGADGLNQVQHWKSNPGVSTSRVFAGHQTVAATKHRGLLAAFQSRLTTSASLSFDKNL